MIRLGFALLAPLAAPQDPIPARVVPPAVTFAADGALASLSLEEATLAEACAALSVASGLKVEAHGQAGRPISVTLEEAGFWEAVLAVARAGEVGLAPVGEAQGTLRLGAEWALPRAAADGPVLLVGRARGRQGERSGELEFELRLAPGLDLAGTSTPELGRGRDFEG